ncbi:MAG TPA: biotin--[acetyl-CoA-carboxylase] ligase [Terriglobales bacterium]
MKDHAHGESSATDERLGQIVRLLADTPMLIVSGTRIAEEIGVSRSEVWRLIEQLREFGVDIAGHPATGYQLEKVPDLLIPDILAPMVRGTTIASRIQHYFRVDSTNNAAMQAGAEGAPHGTVFVAEEQTAGRGRGGHSWTSQPSLGLYLSVLLRPELPPADVIILSLAAGLAVHAAVAELTGAQGDLRWPNDVLFGDRKFCGILTELNAEITRVRYVVVGIGINVNHVEFPADIADLATSICLKTGQQWSRTDLAAILLRALDREYRDLMTSPAEARESILRRFEKHSTFAVGKRVYVPEDGGYEGVTEGLDDRGFLKVRTSSRLCTVLSGGVRAVENGRIIQ